MGWKITVTATATDVTSGMDYVEFFFNDLLQETVNGSGPTFEWSYKYYGGLKVIIKAKAFDKAGLSNSDEVKTKYVFAQSHSNINQISKRSSHILRILSANKI